MTESAVLHDFDPATGIGRLVLNRPARLNAIDLELAQAFLAAAQALCAQPGLRLVVLSGAGRAFAAGGDVASFLADGPEGAAAVVDALLSALHPAILLLHRHPAPLLCAVRGAAAGAGLALALCGDLILADDSARFVLAYTRLGAPGDCGISYFLPRRVGRGMAFDMMLTGRSLTAAEALECRLIDRLLPAPEFEAGVAALAGQIAAGPSLAFGQLKGLYDLQSDLGAHLAAEQAAFIAATRSADFAEGTAAFLAKRAPCFTGA